MRASCTHWGEQPQPNKSCLSHPQHVRYNNNNNINDRKILFSGVFFFSLLIPRAARGLLQLPEEQQQQQPAAVKSTTKPKKKKKKKKKKKRTERGWEKEARRVKASPCTEQTRTSASSLEESHDLWTCFCASLSLSLSQCVSV